MKDGGIYICYFHAGGLSNSRQNVCELSDELRTRQVANLVQWLVGRKAEKHPVLRFAETTGAAAYRLSPKFRLRSIRYGTAMVRLETVRSTGPDLVQGVQVPADME